MTIATSDKLDVYKRALVKLGSRTISSLSENRESRRVLDDNWGSNDNLVLYCLEIGDWNFGTRVVELSYNPSIEPSFGHRRAFDIPTDYRKLTSLSADEHFTLPLDARQYHQVASYWLADLDVIYVKYVSHDDSYGFDSTGWTEQFKELLATRLAWLSCERINNASGKKRELAAEMSMAMASAKSKDAMEEGVKFPPPGSWVRARRGAWGSRSE